MQTGYIYINTNTDGYIKCNICNTEHLIYSGKFFNHIKKKHNILSITEYYYMFNKIDMCIICGKENKKIVNWNYEKLNTCDNHKCQKLYRNKQVSIAQKRIVKEGKHSFQLGAENTSKRNIKLAKEGKHPLQRKDVRDKARERRIKMNKENIGNSYSDKRNTKISESLKKYLNNLSNGDMKKRIDIWQRRLSTDINERINIADNDCNFKGIERVLNG